jgi:hypothetical protein
VKHVLVEIEVAERDMIGELHISSIEAAIEDALAKWDRTAGGVRRDDGKVRGTQWFGNVRVLTEEDPLQ